jgi:hypothetical protein
MNGDLIVLAMIAMIVGGVGFFLVLFRGAYHIGFKVGFKLGFSKAEAMARSIEDQVQELSTLSDVYVARSEAEIIEHMKRMTTKN